jgi:UPF0755 protein
MHHSRTKFSRWLWAIFFFLITFLPALWVYHGLFSQLPLPDTGYRVEVLKGGSINQTVEKLANDNIIPDLFLARLWLHFQPGDKKLKVGLWLLRPPQTTISALSLILAGNNQSASRLTVVEGIRYRDLRTLLAARDDVLSSGVEGDAALLAAIGASESNAEGLFAPDTYEVGGGDTDIKILKSLYQRQKNILDAEWEERAPGLPYKTPYEALIMASIIEKETGTASERAQIAGVFVRRLQKGIRLQTDPTVIYGMGPQYEGRLRRADLLRMTPYNTYRIDGLPPSPIALPGRDAIHAALHPAPGDVLFFVARGDGTHEFNATLAAHNLAVARYQKKRQANYRSTPSESTLSESMPLKPEPSKLESSKKAAP